MLANAEQSLQAQAMTGMFEISNTKWVLWSEEAYGPWMHAEACMVKHLL